MCFKERVDGWGCGGWDTNRGEKQKPDSQKVPKMVYLSLLPITHRHSPIQFGKRWWKTCPNWCLISTWLLLQTLLMLVFDFEFHNLEKLRQPFERATDDRREASSAPALRRPVCRKRDISHPIILTQSLCVSGRCSAAGETDHRPKVNRPEAGHELCGVGGRFSSQHRQRPHLCLRVLVLNVEHPQSHTQQL